MHRRTLPEDSPYSESLDVGLPDSTLVSGCGEADTTALLVRCMAAICAGCLWLLRVCILNADNAWRAVN